MSLLYEPLRLLVDNMDLKKAKLKILINHINILVYCKFKISFDKKKNQNKFLIK